MTTAQSWDTYQSAIASWVLSATGLSTGKVFWAKQNQKQAPGDFVVLDFVGYSATGQDWVDIDCSDPVVAGAEIEHVARGTRQLSVRITAYGGALGENAALARIGDIMLSAKLPTPKTALIAAGLGLAGFGAVTSVGGSLGASGRGTVPIEVEARASVVARFNAVAEVRETATNIDSFEGTVTVKNPPAADEVDNWTEPEP